MIRMTPEAKTVIDFNISRLSNKRLISTYTAMMNNPKAQATKDPKLKYAIRRLAQEMKFRGLPNNTNTCKETS